MKGTVFARPNLKLFLGAALVIVLVQDFITNGWSPTSVSARAAASPGCSLEEFDLPTLHRLSVGHPSAPIYFQMSERYRQQGDWKRARLYLSKAEALADEEEE